MRLAFVLALFCAFSLGCAITPTEMVLSSAERNAATWATKMGISIKGASCSGSDSDNDGYVSCTLALGGLNETKIIECGYDRKLGFGDSCGYAGPNTGCKEWTPDAPVVQQAPQ